LSFAPIATDTRPGEFTPWGTPVPSFYRPHADLTVTVTKGGVSLGFTLAEVAADRRWAIGPDGEVLDQMEFADTLPRVWDDQYRLAGANPQSHAGNAVPRVENYVAWTQDDARPDRLRPIARASSTKPAGPVDTSPLVDVGALRAAGYTLVPTDKPVVAAEAPAEERTGREWTPEQRQAHSEKIKAGKAAAAAERESQTATEG
jgi:hypothetical protein